MRAWADRGYARKARAVVAGLALAVAGASACSDTVEPETGVLFTLEVSGETFRTRVFDPDVIAALTARLDEGTSGVVLGDLVAGDGGVNAPWGWHWAPNSVAVADLVIELCDGRPSMVDADLAYWIDTVGAFCPWGATVVARDP